MRDESTITRHQGLPPGEVSMPTCDLCCRQISTGETYASVRNAVPGVSGSRLREVRHDAPECLKYTHGPASALVPGALVFTPRYAVCDWGGTIPGVITERTERFDGLGWRAYMIAPQNPSDNSIIERFRTHREEIFRKMADSLTIDPAPREVFISDAEWTHYVLPAPTPGKDTTP